jgi:hypothetical protein
MKNLFYLVRIACLLLLLNGCQDDSSTKAPGKISFSFKSSDNIIGGRSKSAQTPSFVSYTLEKIDGTIISDKIELISFGGDFVTDPQMLSPGDYKLTRFLILSSDNVTIYASPLVGSEMAEFVENPLPFSVTINSEITTEVVPEVLALDDNRPEQFGYTTFSFKAIELLSFNVSTTIADNESHNAIDYSLEIIAKDGPLGNVKWTRKLPLHKLAQIKIPSQYQHYTFKASKPGYITHIQHYLKSDLGSALHFELIPETLEDFIKTPFENGLVLYLPKDRCKLYARIDVPEGYYVIGMGRDRNAASKTGYSVSPFNYEECYSPEEVRSTSICNKAVNIFDNRPFYSATDFCQSISLNTTNMTPTLDDVNVSQYTWISLLPANGPPSVDSFYDYFQLWMGINNN